MGMKKKENIPILNLVMGNHDYWNIEKITKKKSKNYLKKKQKKSLFHIKK